MSRGVLIQASFYEAMQYLPDKERLQLYDGICAYMLEGILPENLSPIAKSMFILMKPNMDSSVRKYAASVSNGKKGGRKAKNQNGNQLEEPSGNQCDNQQEKPSENLNHNQQEKPSKNHDYDLDLDSDLDLDLYSDSDSEKDSFAMADKPPHPPFNFPNTNLPFPCFLSGLGRRSSFFHRLFWWDGLPGRGRMDGSSGRYGANQTFWPGANQVLPMGGEQRLPHQVVVLGIPVLNQSPLHGLFVGVRGDVHLLHGSGVQPGVIHHRGQGGGGGVEVLHLLRVVAHLPDVLRQLHRLFQSGAGMAGHEIGHQILIHAILLVQREILVHKFVIHRVPGLSHPGENRIGNVLRSNL